MTDVESSPASDTPDAIVITDKERDEIYRLSMTTAVVREATRPIIEAAIEAVAQALRDEQTWWERMEKKYNFSGMGTTWIVDHTARIIVQKRRLS